MEAQRLPNFNFTINPVQPAGITQIARFWVDKYFSGHNFLFSHGYEGCQWTNLDVKTLPTNTRHKRNTQIPGTNTKITGPKKNEGGIWHSKNQN